MANSICETLRRNGYQALLVGGCARDLLLDREPADYDVTTDARPEQVVKLFPESIAVGAQFGVIVIPRDGMKVEVATFRSDVGYSDGRHPDSVVYSKTPQEDVQRRDFTINGLLMRHDTGEVLDYVGGQADLKTKTIRAIGEPERRFTEDKLRMMRAVRFAARFGFEIEVETFRAIRRHVAEIHQVSPERLRDELTKMLTEGAARQAFELLDETWLLQQVLPEIGAMKGVEQPPQYHPEGDVWIHTRMMLEGLPKDASPTLVGNHMKFGAVEEMRASTLKKFVRLPRFEEHLALHRLDCLSSHRHLDSYEFVRRFLEVTPPEQVRPERLLTGDDLQAMGFRPGPLFSEILRALEDAQLEGQVTTHREAEEYVLSRFGTRERKMRSQ